MARAQHADFLSEVPAATWLHFSPLFQPLPPPITILLLHQCVISAFHFALHRKPTLNRKVSLTSGTCEVPVAQPACTDVAQGLPVITQFLQVLGTAGASRGTLTVPGTELLFSQERRSR